MDPLQWMGAFSSEKVIQIRRELYIDQAQVKTVQTWTYSLEDTLLWIRILARSDSSKLKCLDEFVRSTQLFTSQDVNWWTWVMLSTCGSLWCFYQLFELSFWWHQFTRIPWWASNVMLQSFKPVLMKNKLIYIMDGLRVSTFSRIFSFLV